MTRSLLALLVALGTTLAAASPAEFRAARVPAPTLVELAMPAEKLAAAAEEPSGRLRVGTVRALAKAARLPSWTPVADGFVSRFTAVSEGALGLRVRLDLGAVPGAFEVRVRGEGDRVESMVLDPVAGPEAWTPWTEGASQRVEVFSPVRPSGEALAVGAVLHFTQSPLAKAAGPCTLSTMCVTGDPVLDAAIAERKKSVMRLNFVDGGAGFLCTATLVDTERLPAGYVLTANHCIGNASAAASITSLWFYEATSCASSSSDPGAVQVAGGMQLVFGNYNVDSSLLLMNAAPPSGAVYSTWNPARMNSGEIVVSLSHPLGDTSRYATGAVTQEYRVEGRPQDMYGVRFGRGIIEGGSSGSGIFTLAGGSLQLRGILSGSTVRSGGLSCTNLDEEALYGRFEILHPEIDPYVRILPQAPDDHPNRAQDLFDAGVESSGADLPLDLRGDTLTYPGRRIDYAGDLDVYRFFVTSRGAVSAWTTGGQDTVGTILDSRGEGVEAEDDAERSSTNFGLTRRLDPGTYYALIGHWEAQGTGAYDLKLRWDGVDENHTDLWWNAAESGWGLNVNHQGAIVFATLFTYDGDGTPMWLVMSRGERQADGSFRGTLYRTTGPAFNASPWTPIDVATVGTMSLAFSPAGTATLEYTVNGVSVTKTIERQRFSTAPECGWSNFDRSWATNYQDLWWYPEESGWGLNVTHQGDILFATLFTYAPNGRGMWYVMSRGERIGAGVYRGTLYRTVGPAFNASPWSPITPIAVGTMTLTFPTGNAGTLAYTVDGVSVTKAIQRQVFSTPKTQCRP